MRAFIWTLACTVVLTRTVAANGGATATQERPAPVRDEAAIASPRAAWEASVEVAYRPFIAGNGGAMAYVEEDPRLPRVLIIGDSISIGYTAAVRKALAGKANVLRIPANGGPTKKGLENLEAWLGDERWDVIHFNWGLHDCFRLVPLGEYTANLESLVATLEKTKARLVWASSTPIPDGNPWTQRAGGEVAYNAAAMAVMKKHGIAVDDLHAAITPRFAEFVTAPTDVHFKEPGSEFLGKVVAAAIETQLPPRANR